MWVFEKFVQENNFYKEVAKKVLDLEDITFEEAFKLYVEGDMYFLGWLAFRLKEKLHDKKYYYTVNRHINYTNICIMNCKFCGYHKKPGEKGGYVYKIEDILEMLRNTQELREVHIVGGINPELPYSYYVNLIREIRENFPKVRIRAFTCVEIDWLSKISGKSIEQVLRELKEAGLDSLPGGGAEVFSERLHQQLYPKKISYKRWIEITKIAHNLGISTNATLLFGHLETAQELINHLMILREIQKETRGFYCFIPLPFIKEGNQLSYLPGPSAQKILKTVAISRIVLNNFFHIKAYWVFLGVKLAQVALLWGADHFHGTVIEEKISEAMKKQALTHLPQPEIEKLIREIGGIPISL